MWYGKQYAKKYVLLQRYDLYIGQAGFLGFIKLPNNYFGCLTKLYPASLFCWNYQCLEISCVTNIMSTMMLHQVKPIVKNCESLSIVSAVAEIFFQLPGGMYIINWGLERIVQASFTPPSQQGIGLCCRGILTVHPGGKRWNRGNLWSSIPNYLSRRGTISSKWWSAPWYALCSNENFYIFVLLEAL